MKKPTDKTYHSTCSYCGVGCGVVIRKDSSNKLSLEGDENHPVNRGMLCSKGRTLQYTVMDKSDRLLYPMMRWNRVCVSPLGPRVAARRRSVAASHFPATTFRAHEKREGGHPRHTSGSAPGHPAWPNVGCVRITHIHIIPPLPIHYNHCISDRVDGW